MNRLLSFILAFICLAAALPLQAQDSGIEQFNMPRKDGRQGDKTVSGQLQFYDIGGPDGDSPGGWAGYTRFVPATEGNQISVDFETLDLQGEAYVYVYDGDIDFSSFNSSVPDGYLGQLTGEVSGQSFQSTTGSLSVLYYCHDWSSSGFGWVATVEEFTPKDMEWQSVAVAQAAANAFRGQLQAPIISANLITDGGGAPFSCTELSFTLAGTTNFANISSVKVIYSKGSNVAEGVQFGEALAPAEGTLTFTGSQELRGGNNYFWLVADVAPNAAPSDKLDATLTGAMVAGTQRVAAAMAAEGDVTIDNMALISAVPTTYSIGSQALTFYDDGGAEGDVTEGFDGVASFTPTTPGKVIKATFTTLDLFNTSSTGLNDVLNIYAGTEKSNEALIATLLKETTPVAVTSNAADGSLTISFTSTTGYPKPGFVATIEEVEPVAMAIQTADATHPASGTVCAGDEDVKMLQVRVNAAGTASPVQVSAMTFANPSQAPVAKAKLYWCGVKADGTASLVGETATPGAEFTITLSTPVSLNERDNYFLLCYDLDAKATNGQTLDASLTRINADYNVTEGNPEGNMTVLNVYASTSNSAVKTVYGEWQFTNRPSTSSWYGYDDTEGNQVTTFLPGNTGKTIEIDFTQFNLSTSNYMPDPTFTVYDGKDTNAEVLWAAGKVEMTTGPGRVLRATNADGAITVLFNTNGGRGSSGCGFKATVSEYSPMPMTVQSVTASQMSDAEAVRPGTKDLPVLSINAVMNGDQNPLSFDALTLNLKDDYSVVSKVKLYTTGRNAEFATTKLVAEAEVSAAAVTLTPTLPYTMPEKASYYWVTFDMADSFASDMVVDAAVTELKLGGAAVTVTTPDPEGSAVTKNLYYFQDGDNTITVNGSLLFYDNMGPDAKYNTEAKGSVTFKPAKEGEVIRMTVMDFWTSWKDHLYFYDGAAPAQDATPIVDLSGDKEESEIAPIISKAEDGAITVKFDPQAHYNEGWEILVESFVPKPMQISKVEVTPVNDVKMLRGSGNNKLLKLAVTVEGEKDKATLDKLQFSALETAEGAVTAAKVYYTGAIDAFDTSTLYGTAQTVAPYTFEGNVEYDAAGTYYYWLTYDIATEIENDSKVQAQFLSLTSGETTLTPAEETKVLVTVQDGMHGVYTVGTSGDYDYNTVQEAVDALTGGIDGPVVFELVDGNYNELVTIPAVVGSSELNTVTIRSKSGNRDNVVISYDDYRDPGSGAYDQRYGVVTFDGIDYCTLENVTVTSTDMTFPGLIFSRNKSEYITVRGCAVKQALNLDSSKGTTLINQYAKDEANCNNNFLTVEDCLIEGGYIGIAFRGTGTVALPAQRGGVARNNTFVNQGSKAIYVQREEDAVITGNNVLCEGESTSSYNAFDISDAGGNVDISGNVIRIKDNTGTRTPNPVGIYVRGYSIDKIKKGTRRIYNNEINMSGCPGSSATAIRVNTEIPDLEIVNNTISIGATEGEDAPSEDRVHGIYMAGGIKGGRIVNNIIQCATPGYVIYVQRRNYLDGGTFSHNVCYVPGEGKFGYIGATPSSSGTDPEGFTAGSLDFEGFCTWAPMTDSHFEQTTFLSENVLEPAAAGSLVAGLPMEYVTTDLYGAERSATTPTIGAYEYAESTVAPAMAEGYPVIKEVAHDEAVAAVKSSLTGTVYYAVLAADEAAPDAAAIKNEDFYAELRKGVETDLKLEGLQPNTTYVLYSVLASLRGMESEVIASAPFTTTYEPTRVATFEAAEEQGMRLVDGTMSFTGFSVEAIEDGVAPAPNTKAAVMDDIYAVIQLTNAPNLSLEGLFMRNTANVTITTKDDELKEVKTKEVAPSATWRYVDLKDMGLFTYIELESEGDVAIDNVGAAPLEMLLGIDRDEQTAVKAGEEYTLTVTVDGGVAPYTYDWKDAARNSVAQTAAYTYTPQVSGTYTVEVTDARGAKASAATKVRVLGDMAIATFDDLYLEPESHWCGDVDDEDYMQGSFFSGSYEFNNLYMADWDSWSFFGYSNHTSTSFSSYTTDQWNSAVGHGVDDSANYGVVYISTFMGKTLTTVTNNTEGQVIPGMYVTNSAWVVDAVLNGDGMSPAFGENDNLMLKIKGTAADGTESSLEIPLADYRAADEIDRWYLDTWQWVDLSVLGPVVSLEWDMTSTKSNNLGMTTPAYVCIDNLGASRPVTDAATVTLKVNEEEPVAEFDLAPYFSFNAAEGTITYSMECTDERVALEGSKVTCSAKGGETLELVAHASQRGCNEWVRIPIVMESKPLSVTGVELEGVALYPNPADAFVNVSAASASYDVQVISMDGRTVMSRTGLDGTATLDVSSLSEGTYLVKLIGNDGAAAVRKLIVKH